jgi:tight adherence protein B
VEQLWLIFVMVFGAVLLAVQAAYMLVFRVRSTQKAVNRRLALTQQLSNPTAVLEALRNERGLIEFKNPWFVGINDYLAQTGLKIDRRVLIVATIGIAVVCFLLLSLRFGFGLLSLMLAIVLAITLVALWLRRTRSRRIARFSEQFPDALDVIVRGVRVGHPFSTALSLVAKEMPDPIGTEFGMASDEIAFGLDVRRAIENLYRRVGQEDLLFFVVSVNVQSQTGGNLAEILSRLSGLVRNRSKIRAKVKALTAEGRMSALFLSLLPFILFGLINLVAPAYYSAVRDHPATMPALIFGLSLLAIGNLIMYRMVNFKY